MDKMKLLYNNNKKLCQTNCVTCKHAIYTPVGQFVDKCVHTIDIQLQWALHDSGNNYRFIYQSVCR